MRTLLSSIILSIFVVLLSDGVWSYDPADHLKNYPTPFTAHNRLMGFILSFNHYHIDPLMLIVNEYVSMCEAGWQPTIMIFTTVDWSPALHRYFRQKLYCYRIDDYIRLDVEVHDPAINIALGAEHRKILGRVLYQHDVFVYHEDDMIFKLSHLSGYLHETKLLHTALPENGLRDHCIGFQRYRRIPRGNDIHLKFGEQDIFEQELLEEMPSFRQICMNNQAYLHVTGNIHQAIWALTQQQILMLQEKCSFLNQTSASREFMSSFSLFDHKKYHCGLNKLLPAERLSTFAIQHYYQQRHVSWTPVFSSAENLIAGFEYSSRSVVDLPDCWKPIAQKNQAHQAMTDPPTRSPTAKPVENAE